MQIAKWGNSFAVRIPADVMRSLNLKEGDEVDLCALDNGSVAVITAEQRRRAAFARIRELAEKHGKLPADFKFDREWANSRESE
jgi:antitoxin MazE